MIELINKNELLSKRQLIINWALERERKGYGTTIGECIDKVFDEIKNMPIVDMADDK